MPAGWFLSEYLLSKGIRVDEIYHNVNQPYEKIYDELMNIKPDILLFSVYIFNVKTVKTLIKDIKKYRPEIKIIVGGPEVDENFYADHIIIGEGERALYNLLLKKCDKVIIEDEIKNLDELPSPYTRERLQNSKNKLIYYESSRGCPFSCSYCMASLSDGVRYFSFERVKDDLDTIVESGAKVVKFTDRTFNANTIRTNKILQYIYNNYSGKNSCFHFEVGGDLFEDSTLKILKKMPEGLIQIEAGVQTLNEKSLEAINRKFKKEKFIHNISKIIEYGNIHVHLDLIAGLPLDNLQSFIHSFNETIALNPHMLQLGFLKFLKGTPLRLNYNAKYNKQAPYEIISSAFITEKELYELKRIDYAVDKLYNSGKFYYTINYLLKKYDTPYEMFSAISDFFKKQGIKKGDYENKLYKGLLDFISDTGLAKEYLRFDYLITNNSRKIPRFLRNEHSERFKQFLSKNRKSKYFMYDEFKFLPINKNRQNFVVKFDYSKINPVTKQYSYCIITI